MKVTHSLFALLLIHASAQGAVVMLDPTFVSCTAPLLNGTTSYQNIVNQSGLSTGYTNQVTPLATFLAAAPTSGLPATNFTLTSGTTASYVFDLGASANLANVVFWNSISGAGNRAATFSVKVSDTSSFTTSTALGTFTTSTSNPSYPVAAEVYTLAPAVGRYVQVDLTNAGGTAVTFGEIAFAGTIPEPSSTALLGGLGLLAFARRRRLG
jgi:hypothetical protein